MTFKSTALILSSAMGLSFSLQLMAAVSETEAAKLGNSLTPIGAEMAGNTAGTIPAWDGGLPPGGERFKDPYADEQPILTITAENASKHKQHLTEGQLALLAKYPDTFKMNMYVMCSRAREALYMLYSTSTGKEVEVVQFLPNIDSNLVEYKDV